MMSLTGNKGEWSEIYVLLHVLGAGKIFSADETMSQATEVFFPILSVMREVRSSEPMRFELNETRDAIVIHGQNREQICIPRQTFSEEAQKLLEGINRQPAGNGSFSMHRTESFLSRLNIFTLKAPSSEKADIHIRLHDIRTGHEHDAGFSIKSELGSPPTLLNASLATNFTYIANGLQQSDIEHILNIASNKKLKDRVKAIYDAGGRLEFESMDKSKFRDNLMMIDSDMPQIVSRILLAYYKGGKSSMIDILRYIVEENFFDKPPGFYEHKIKELLWAIALGMRPATRWNGNEEATGGYIVVKATGEVMAYYRYNRVAFKTYLLNNTKLESAASGRHRYGSLYEERGSYRMKLNLQIRFK